MFVTNYNYLDDEWKLWSTVSSLSIIMNEEVKIDINLQH